MLQFEAGCFRSDVLVALLGQAVILIGVILPLARCQMPVGREASPKTSSPKLEPTGKRGAGLDRETKHLQTLYLSFGLKTYPQHLPCIRIRADAGSAPFCCLQGRRIMVLSVQGVAKLACALQTLLNVASEKRVVN